MPSSAPSAETCDDLPDDGSLLTNTVAFARQFGRRGGEAIYQPVGCRPGGLVAAFRDLPAGAVQVVCITDVYTRPDGLHRKGPDTIFGHEGTGRFVPREYLKTYGGPADRSG